MTLVCGFGSNEVKEISMKRLVFTIFGFILAHYAWANDAAVRGISGMIAPVDQHPSVCMVSEEVSAKIGWDAAAVRCHFVFKNDGGPTSVKMGFPEEASGDVGPIKHPAFKSFKAWVDGKPIKTKFFPSMSEQNGDLIYRAWHVKDLSFSAGQKRVVVNEYEAPLGVDSMGGKFFTYILTSGKNWKGKIGNAKITVDVSTSAQFYKIIPSPAGYACREGKVIWEFKNFEPHENISIRLEPKVKATLNNAPVFLSDAANFQRTGVFMSAALQIPAALLWKPKTKECTIAAGNHKLRMKIGSKDALLDDDKNVKLSCAPYVYESRLIVPIVEVVRYLGGSVAWDSTNKTIKMTIGN